MIKGEKNTSKCPCCKQQVKAKGMQNAFSLLPFDGVFIKYHDSYEESLQENIRRDPSAYQWACDDCIKEARAIKANPKKQFYNFKSLGEAAIPFLAYYNIGLICKTCKDHFSFSKEEQRFWYEDLQFVVFSKPLNCRSCRANIREGKNLNAELSDLLRLGKPEDIESLERIGEIYQEMGKVEKMKAYRKAAKKQKAKRG